MRNRIFRFLVCLVLVCVILVNCSPIRARAVEPVTVMIGAGIVIAAAVIGLGVMMGSDPLVFDELVSKIASHEKMSDIISVDFKLPVIRYNAITGGIDPQGMSWALSVLVLETIREILFEEDVLTEDASSGGFCSYNGHILPLVPSASSYPFELLVYRPDTQTYYFGIYNKSFNCASSGSNNYFNIQKCNAKEYMLVDGVWVFQKQYSNGYPSQYNSQYFDFVWCNFDIVRYNSSEVVFHSSDPVPASSVGVSDGLTAGEIAPQTQTILDGYPSWSSGSLIDENQNYWYPIGIGQTYDETKTYTQEQIQSGESTYQEEDTGTDEDSDAEQITATGLRGWLADIKDRMTLLLQPISMKVSNIYDSVTEGLSSIGQSIVNLPGDILSGIYDLFIPSPEAMAAQQEKWTTLLSDRFGAVYDSVALIDNIAGAFTLGATQTQIRFPLITIPFGDVNWEFGGWMVDVVPDGFQVLVDALKVGIDILCTLAFVNAMKHRFDRVLEGRG